MKPHKTKILSQFLMFVLPFVILAITVTSAVLMWSNYRHFRRTIAQDYQNILTASAGEIRLFMTYAQKNMDTLAWVLATDNPDPYNRKMALTAFNHVNSEFRHVSLTSPKGQVIATTRWNDDRHSQLDDKLLQQAISGKSGFSDIQFAHEELPRVTLAVPGPGIDQTGTILWGELNLKFVWDVLEGITVGQNGHVYIMDVTGNYIAHRDVSQVLTASSHVPEGTLERIRKAVAPVSWFEKWEGQTFYCLGSYVPDLEWIVTLRQPTKEIYYHLFQNLLWAGIIIVAACFITIVFGWYRIKLFLKPIDTLHQQVQAMGAGNLNQRVTVTSTDEIGNLGIAFNNMAHALEEKIRKEVASAQALAHAQDLAVLGASASKVTHEVGNLLNNVGMATHAIGDESLSPRGQSALSKMEKESNRVQAFIQNFLKFAKPPDLQIAPLSLDLILHEVIVMYAGSPHTRGIKFDMDWPDDAPKIPADARLLYQVFNNLIKNSTEAMAGKGHIRVSATVRNDYLTVSLRDNGTGIAPEHLERVFEPFFTTKGKKGTGLGMAIVKSTITAHRGTITCQSEPKQGTRIIIHLPLK